MKTDLERLEQLEKRATPGPWVWEKSNDYIHQGSHLGYTLISLDDTYENHEIDCELIEQMKLKLPSLIAELKACREVVESVMDEMSCYTGESTIAALKAYEAAIGEKHE